MEYRFPTVQEGGKVTHVLVPVEEYLRLEDAARSVGEGEVFFPIDVSHAVLGGVSPIRAWREYLHLTQEELAKRIGITAAAISRLEKPDRKPRFSTLISLAEALELEDENMLIKLYD
ncbi:helix-turn-helix domain-containing protein [Desulfovibrio mangrovi]|uniref:helix-turn-helix domain-containing protein n=1 Tax=Desulfovibrio mangrovi TaxID=2976983 RepID=UPI002248487E|nr:helix-turn-helix transcriptional regulator [Desulfovibrio mangrovi]UZP68965.1 helix-turn-helix domain-containing protein [Desulfovibrio mangrovi]